MTVELVRPEWHKDIREVRVLFAWLVDTGRILSLTEAKDFLDAPLKFQPEHEEMLREEEAERWLAEQMADEEAWAAERERYAP